MHIQWSSQQPFQLGNAGQHGPQFATCLLCFALPLYLCLCSSPLHSHTHTHTLRSCCKANLFKLKVNTLSPTHAHTYTLNVILEALHGPLWATPIYFGNTIKYTIALVINRNASLAFFPSPLLPRTQPAVASLSARSAALCVCTPLLLTPPPLTSGKLCCSLCVQLIDALTDFAFVPGVACEERDALPPAAWANLAALLTSSSSTSTAMARTDCATSCWPRSMALMFTSQPMPMPLLI